MQNLEQIAHDAAAAFAATDDPDALEQIKARFRQSQHLRRVTVISKDGTLLELQK